MSRRKQANPKSFKLTEDLKLSNNNIINCSTNNPINIECKPDLEEIKIKIEPETR
jgi:hypothetical protein